MTLVQNGKDFDYRFTGKDSRIFLHNFMFLVDVLEVVLKARVHYLPYMSMLTFAFVCVMQSPCLAVLN